MAKRIEKPLVLPDGYDQLEPLIKIREKLGFSRGDLAASSGIAYPYICNAENGRLANVTPSLIERYRQGLDRLIEAKKALKI